LTDSQSDILKSRGINVSTDVANLSATIRQLVNLCIKILHYTVVVNQEAEKFLFPGFYHGDPADSMVLALANVLQCSIVVFSSSKCHPVFCITPKVQAIPIYVRYLN